MITLILNDTEYQLPQDLTVDQWSDIIKWDLYDPQHWARILNIVTGLDFTDAPEEGMKLGIVFVTQMMTRRKETQHNDFNNMKFGEWVDLDIYIAQGLEKSIKDVLRVLGTQTTSASEALYVIDKYNHWRSFILRQYSYLFDIDNGSSDDNQEDVDWKRLGQSWYRIIVELSGDNILNIDEVTDQPVRKVFQFLQLRKQKAVEEQLKQVKQKHDLQRTRR